VIELVVPEALDPSSRLDDTRYSLRREMVGRRVFAADGPLDEVLTTAEELSADVRGGPVLVNDVVDRDEHTRMVDVYVHRDGRCLSVSEGVERPNPE
jgi:hypothetical protein